MMFGKIYRQIFDSSINRDHRIRDVFQDLIILSDRHGVVDMTYEAIARTTNRPIEIVIFAIGELMKEDRESRSKKQNGARLVLVDDRRTWGWRIVNHGEYRDMRDDEARKRYRAEWMRKHRRRVNNVNTREQACTKRGAREQKGARVIAREQACTDEPDLPRQTVNTREQACTAMNTRELACTHADTDTDVPSAVSLKGRQQAVDPELYIIAFDEAKHLICERILGGKNPARPWSYEAQENLARQLPIPRLELERVAWFRGLPDDGSPELAARKTVTENGLCMFWSDEVTRAEAYWQQRYGWREKKCVGRP